MKPLAVICLAGAALLASAQVSAQALNPAWDGEWLATETTQGQPGAGLQVLRKGGQSQMVQTAQACPLAYDGLIEPAALARRIQALQAWQLNPQHWPAGVNPAQLVGLRNEFDRALQLVGSLSGPRYRVARMRGEGCDDADDIFFVLHQGQRLVRVRFPSASLGVDMTVFQRKGLP
jgi:hypothetical protein